ncbi:hypothetical protein N7510_007226 [Penicillium lagena]|uniref:uncharacterized protein n=1 Tax=Penicillium lagena TaxID=94218 RepID=UPI0025416CA9|nr:uncharacterized protein N7510_007226 [Penicillium lagena]KAJ5610507.1 hypothetical protein N7510_007226 [Penicillium lagena]
MTTEDTGPATDDFHVANSCSCLDDSIVRRRRQGEYFPGRRCGFCDPMGWTRQPHRRALTLTTLLTSSQTAKSHKINIINTANAIINITGTTNQTTRTLLVAEPRHDTRVVNGLSIVRGIGRVISRRWERRARRVVRVHGTEAIF